MTRTILLADDSVTIQKVVELTFMDEDFRVVSVGTGTEAIERLAEVSPDIVIADVHMPGADGYEVADWVRTNRPGTPVLLLAGTFEVFDADRAQSVGAAAHLKKPFDSQELLRRVREMIEAPSAPSGPAPAVSAAAVPEGGPGTAETSKVAATSASGLDWSIPVEDEPDGASSWSVEVDGESDLESTAQPFDSSAGAAALPDLEAAPEFEPLPSLEPIVAAQPEDSRPAVAGSAAPGVNGSLSDDDVERIARRIAELIGDKVVREVAWEVVPDLAEVLLKARIRELESSVE